MRSFVLLLSLFGPSLQVTWDTANCGQGGSGPPGEAQIVDGVESGDGQWPWQVSLRVDNFFSYDHSCGGSIINNQWILTAAHCLNAFGFASDYQIEYGTNRRNQGTQVSVADYIMHEGYDSDSSENDIALMRLTTPISGWTSRVRPICQPSASNSYNGNTVTVSGWGTEFSGGSVTSELRHVQKTVISNSQCQNSYSDIFPSSLCAGLDNEGDSCQGDSGGPLQYNDNGVWRQVGIVSWGRGCAQPGYPGVYARVTSYLAWIRNQ
ncbi:unnamed protein product [Owenia fusiformis]|uniref:Uncharacterized protein n=1 Tax=Owenia fusiformis TaxID=6347 RepID=A0A8J1TQ92_OWEFU|nr:unnamed protein product [Owenia fusiformis]